MKHTRILALAMLLSATLCSADLAPAAARLDAAGPSPAPPGPHRQGQFFPVGEVEPGPSSPYAPHAIPGWSKLVFQSFRDDNWEIYRANGDGSGQSRVTNDPGVDYSPRLSPGAGRIAFVSNRAGGDYDIFVVEWDGAGLAALTSNGVDDVAPAWSPDGSQLAFESYRDGQAEIYRMNADGATQTRLTNHGAYDGTPAWSPDGAKIAFTSRRTGSYQVWVMDADGGDPRALTTQTNAYDPAWSPDGAQIAYDADADGDGFEELWLMDADGSNQREVYDPPQGNQVAWPRSWSVDGRYIAYSRLTFVGQYTTEAIVAAWDSLAPNTMVPLGAGNRDANPDWQATEYPDLWLSQARTIALPGEQVELELTYGNQGTVTASNVRITAQLAAGLIYLGADPPPVATSPALRWTKSALPASSGSSVIHITARVAPTVPLGSTLASAATVRSNTSEFDLSNNSILPTLYVGWVGYLPLVAK